jgi:hypothetical protein
MLRNEVLTGIQALRHSIESFATLSDDDIAYFENVLIESRNAILINEANDPYAK